MPCFFCPQNAHFSFEAIPATSVDGDDEGSLAALNTTVEEEENPTECDDADGQKSAAVEHIDVKLKVLCKRKEIASVELKLLEKKVRIENGVH